MRVGCGGVVAAAAGDNGPHVAGEVGARGAEPPEGGRAAQVRNSLRVNTIGDARSKIAQCCTFARVDIAVLVVNFRCAQQEDLAGQTVCSLLRRTTRTAVLAIRELYLLDCALNVAIKQFQERVVQVRVDVAAFVLVDISALPNTVLVDVLHQ